MFCVLLVLAFCAAGANSLGFDNSPIITGEDLSNPFVTLNGDTYYLVTTSLATNTTDKFTLHYSTNLKSWTKLPTSIFNDNNPVPRWTNGTERFSGPEIHFVNSKFLLYFSAPDATNGENEAIGVAEASAIQGPYTAVENTIPVSNNPSSYPTYVNGGTSTTLYIFWNETSGILGRRVDSNGETIPPGESFLLIQPDRTWEGGNLVSPTYFKRGNYSYIFYTAHSLECDANSVIGVARSQNVLGPYEKLGSPFISTSTSYPFNGIGHTSIVKDVDGVTDALIFNAYAGSGSSCNSRSIFAKNIRWGADNWPFVD